MAALHGTRPRSQALDAGPVPLERPRALRAGLRVAAARGRHGLTAAFTGLRRGELVALRWRDIAFAAQRVRVCGSFAGGRLTSPKSGKVRSVPMAPDSPAPWARLAARGRWTGDDDLVFPGCAGSYLDASALARRYKTALRRAALRPLRFHDLRHTFGTRMIAKPTSAACRMDGPRRRRHTMKYLHYVERSDEAELVAAAFALESPGSRRPHIVDPP